MPHSGVRHYKKDARQRHAPTSGPNFFRDIRPVNTIMQISRFIDPEWLIETEVDAVVSDV